MKGQGAVSLAMARHWRRARGAEHGAPLRRVPDFPCSFSSLSLACAGCGVGIDGVVIEIMNAQDGKMCMVLADHLDRVM